MKKLKLRWISAICIIMAFTILTGCSMIGLSDKFDEEEVKKAAENVVGLVNAKDIESLQAMSIPEMKEVLNEATINQIHEELENGGKFERIENISLESQEDKGTKEEYAVTVVKAKYENKNFIYTISFNEKMELAGLYVK